MAEWISVYDRLPSIDDLCLLCMENRITKYRWIVIGYYHADYDEYVTHWQPLPELPRTPKERGAEKPEITCLNCKHLMFSDIYGECNKQLRIVNPSDTCEYAEPKERGGEK